MYKAHKEANRHLIAGSIALLLAVASTSAQASSILDTIVSSADSASGGWMNTALGYARNLFFSLAAIEFVWAGAQLLLQKGEVSEALTGLLMKIVSIAFFGMVLTQAPVWIPAIMDSFKQAGSSIGGVSQALSPSSVIDKGLTVAGQMVEKGLNLNGGFWKNAFGDGLAKWMLSAIVIGFSGLIVVLAYVVVAIQMAITLIESYLIIGGGVLMLGFLGSRWTLNLGEKMFGYAISNGVKLLTIYLIVGFGDKLSNSIIQAVADIASQNGGHLGFTDFLGVAGASAAYGAIGYLVPGLAGSMLNGSPSLSMSNVGTAGKGIASAPIGGALAGTAAGARALGLGAAGLGYLASKFGGTSGSIVGSLRGDGSGSGGGSLIGAFGRAGGAVSAGGSGGFAKSGFGGAGGAVSAGGSGGSATPSFSGSSDASAGESGGASVSSARGSAASGLGNLGGDSSAGGAGNLASTGATTSTGVNTRPGFQSPRSMATASVDPDRREFDQMANPSNIGQQQQPRNKISRFADGLKNFARETQYASYRFNSHLGHDGNTGGAPSIRLNM